MDYAVAYEDLTCLLLVDDQSLNIIEKGIVYVESASCGPNNSLCEHRLTDMKEFTVQKLTCTDVGVIA